MAKKIRYKISYKEGSFKRSSFATTKLIASKKAKVLRNSGNKGVRVTKFKRPKTT